MSKTPEKQQLWEQYEFIRLQPMPRVREIVEALASTAKPERTLYYFMRQAKSDLFSIAVHGDDRYRQNNLQLTADAFRYFREKYLEYMHDKKAGVNAIVKNMRAVTEYKIIPPPVFVKPAHQQQKSPSGIPLLEAIRSAEIWINGIYDLSAEEKGMMNQFKAGHQSGYVFELENITEKAAPLLSEHPDFVDLAVRMNKQIRTAIQYAVYVNLPEPLQKRINVKKIHVEHWNSRTNLEPLFDAIRLHRKKQRENDFTVSN